MLTCEYYYGRNTYHYKGYSGKKIKHKKRPTTELVFYHPCFVQYFANMI